MNAYISMGTRSDRVDVSYHADMPSGPHVVLRLGDAGIHLDPATARKLAEDILAALPAAVTA